MKTKVSADNLSVSYLNEDENVVAISTSGNTIPEPCAPFTASYSDNISVLEHHVIDPHTLQGSGSGYRQRVLCTEILHTPLFYSIYLRYGARLFRMINGRYEIFQVIHYTKSLLQISGKDLTVTCKYGKANMLASGQNPSQATSQQ